MKPKQRCKHPTGRLRQDVYHETDHHPYGEDTYQYLRIKCTKCGTVSDDYAGWLNPHGGNLTRIYEDFTNREISDNQLKILYKKAPSIFFEFARTYDLRHISMTKKEKLVKVEKLKKDLGVE